MSPGRGTTRKSGSVDSSFHADAGNGVPEERGVTFAHRRPVRPGLPKVRLAARKDEKCSPEDCPSGEGGDKPV